ncbi:MULTISPECIES: hypothetical protein [Firmicutes]
MERLKALPPEKIIDSSYEKVFKEEFMTTVKNENLSRTDINTHYLKWIPLLILCIEND